MKTEKNLSSFSVCGRFWQDFRDFCRQWLERLILWSRKLNIFVTFHWNYVQQTEMRQISRANFVNKFKIWLWSWKLSSILKFKLRELKKTSLDKVECQIRQKLALQAFEHLLQFETKLLRRIFFFFSAFKMSNEKKIFKITSRLWSPRL